MATIHRLKHNFTAGEISPLASMLVDFSRFKNGCLKMKNMMTIAQGPATRRMGFEFIYNLNRLGFDYNKPSVCLIPFIYDEDNSYILVIYRHTNGKKYCVFATDDGLIQYPDPPPTECPDGKPYDPLPVAGDIVTLELPDFRIDQVDYAQAGDELYVAQADSPPHMIVRHSHECWEYIQIQFTEQPDEWSDENGWPELVTFHQQRLVYACTKLKPRTLWFSRAGDLHNFDDALLKDDSGFAATLNAETQSKIQWILSKRALNTGTLASEFTITGATSYAVAYNNLLSERHSSQGSERIKALSVNFATLFVERHGRVVNEFVYEYNFDSFKANDLSILSPHLTEFNSIRDWAYAQTPYSILWCVRGDGDMIALTYQRDQKVVAWHFHNTEGKFYAVETKPSQQYREDEVWVVVKRQNGFFLERKAREFKYKAARLGLFLDSYAVYDGDPVNTISGLDHLNGMEISLLCDGATHPPVTVANGEVKLNWNYSKVVAGLPYRSELRPTITEIGLEDGSAQGRMQRILDVDIIFYNTLGCTIGRIDREDGVTHVEDLPFRVPGDLTGKEVPLYNGVYNYSFPEGYDEKLVYFIRQDQPLPMTVLAIVDTVDIGD